VPDSLERINELINRASLVCLALDPLWAWLSVGLTGQCWGIGSVKKDADRPICQGHQDPIELTVLD
jgi:hypothetical protein